MEKSKAGNKHAIVSSRIQFGLQEGHNPDIAMNHALFEMQFCALTCSQVLDGTPTEDPSVLWYVVSLGLFSGLESLAHWEAYAPFPLECVFPCANYISVLEECVSRTCRLKWSSPRQTIPEDSGAE